MMLIRAPLKRRSLFRGITPARAVNGMLLAVLAILTLYPFWYVLCVSVSTHDQILGAGILLWPRGFNLDAVKYVLTARDFSALYINTFFVVIVGTALSMALTIGFAYGLARRVRGHHFLSFFVFFTLLFNGGMIPTFLVVRSTGLLDTLWALILPRVADPFYIFLMRNFLQSIPESLDESASLDGAGVMTILVKIILPISLPGIATISLFYGVLYWNNFFDAVLYISSRSKWTIQVLLREILISVQPDILSGAGTAGDSLSTPYTVKMATVLLAVVPVMLIYPFIQRYFVTGMVVGAVKG